MFWFAISYTAAENTLELFGFDLVPSDGKVV